MHRRARRDRRRRDPGGRSPPGPRSGVRGTRARRSSPARRSTPRSSPGAAPTCPFLEQEAENAVTNGEVIGPTARRTRCPAEASGRDRRATRPGRARGVHAARGRQRDHRALQHPRRPDGRRHHRAARRSPSTAGRRSTMTLTSEYAWLYNQYPFTNDPNADLLHPDWWITECGCVPGRRATRCRSRSARCTSTTSSGCSSARRTRPATVVRLTVPRGHGCRVDGDRPARLRARGAADGAARRLGERHAVRGRPDRPARRRRRVRRGDRLRAAPRPHGVHPGGHVPGRPARHRRRRHDPGRRQLALDRARRARSR